MLYDKNGNLTNIPQKGKSRKNFVNFAQMPPDKQRELSKRGGIAAAIKRREDAIFCRKMEIAELQDFMAEAIENAYNSLCEYVAAVGDINRLKEEIHAFSTKNDADRAFLGWPAPAAKDGEKALRRFMRREMRKTH